MMQINIIKNVNVMYSLLLVVQFAGYNGMQSRSNMLPLCVQDASIE